MFYIMRAHHLTSVGRKLNLARIIQDHPSCTILAVTCHTAYKDIDRYIIGSGKGYDVKAGDKDRTTIDTGLGLRNRGEEMTINHVYEFENGLLTSVDGQPYIAVTMLPKTEAAYAFVMK